MKIDEWRGAAESAVADGHYFEAERLAQKALTLCRSLGDFTRLIQALAPLKESRRQRLRIAMERGCVQVIDEPITEEMPVAPGCYLVQPPQVGADARRLRLLGQSQEVPLAVVCREPQTQTGLWPIVAICPGTTVRTRIEPPDEHDAPDLDWFGAALDELGDWAIASIDTELEASRRLDLLLDRLTAVPDHEGLHDAIAAVCRELLARGPAEAAAPRRSRTRG
jgi:hypothetical protein